VVEIPTKEAEFEAYEKAGKDTQLEKAQEVIKGLIGKTQTQ
jgi:hypothetical protein